MAQVSYHKLIYVFLIISFIINPFIYMGNLSRHDNLPAYPILIFKTNPAALHELQSVFAQLRLDNVIEQSTAKYETHLPYFTAPFLSDFNLCALHLANAFKLPLANLWLGLVAEFSLSVKQIDLPFPDKPPTLALSA